MSAQELLPCFSTCTCAHIFLVLLGHTRSVAGGAGALGAARRALSCLPLVCHSPWPRASLSPSMQITDYLQLPPHSDVSEEATQAICSLAYCYYRLPPSLGFTERTAFARTLQAAPRAAAPRRPIRGHWTPRFRIAGCRQSV
jgi:hypothetical protein